MQNSEFRTEISPIESLRDFKGVSIPSNFQALKYEFSMYWPINYHACNSTWKQIKFRMQVCVVITKQAIYFSASYSLDGSGHFPKTPWSRLLPWRPGSVRKFIAASCNCPYSHFNGRGSRKQTGRIWLGPVPSHCISVKITLIRPMEARMGTVVVGLCCCQKSRTKYAQRRFFHPEAPESISEGFPACFHEKQCKKCCWKNSTRLHVFFQAKYFPPIR